MKHRLKVSFINELPFMIHLPNDDYVIKFKCMDGKERDFVINLNNDIYRLHMNPFPSHKTAKWIDGEREELEKFVSENRVVQYAVVKLKTYISCSFEDEFEFTEDMIDSIGDEKVIEHLRVPLLNSALDKKISISKEEADEKAKESFDKLTQEEIYDWKKQLILYGRLNAIFGLVYDYQKALNTLIGQYSYVRGDFFVEPLTMHTLEGTYCYKFIDGKVVDQTKVAGKIPTIVTNRSWMNDIDSADLQTLKNRLISNYAVPPTKSLILTAKNLLERGEYRSAIIEANAGLEIAVAEKITEKMKIAGENDLDIDNYLSRTETNFYQRCDYQLKAKASKSFVTDNTTLWDSINSHRKTFRHKIAHTSLIPDLTDVEVIIKDFEKAILWVESI